MSVSVIMATHNKAHDIGLAMASVLLQDLESWELVVVNDASTDETAELLERFALKDDRVVAIHNQHRLGRARARNKAIEASAGEFIAVLDADDIAMPSRLARQVSYLEAHHDVGILGGWTIRIDRDNRPLDVLDGPTEDGQVRRSLRSLRMPFHHCTVMFRRDALTSAGLYDPRFTRSQDSHLCRRVIQVTKGAALPEFLLLYRVDPEEPAEELRERARWSARSGWDSWKKDPNVAGIANLLRFLVMSKLPASALDLLSGMKRRRVVPSAEQVARIEDWVALLRSTSTGRVGNESVGTGGLSQGTRSA